MGASLVTIERQGEDLFELSREQLDALPYGVITLDRRGLILRYNYAEAAFARRTGKETIGLGFFTEVAPCTNVQAFKGRFDSFALGSDSGVDRFDFTFAFRWGSQDVSITLLRKADREEINLIVRGRTTSSRDIAAVPGFADRARADAAPPATVPEAGAAARALGFGTQELDCTTAWRAGSAQEIAWRANIHPDDATSRGRIVAAAAARRKPYALEYRTCADGNDRRVVQEHGIFASDDDAPAYVTILDVTERRRNESELWTQAHYDQLTGLPNRDLLLERIAAAASDASAHERVAAVISIGVSQIEAIGDAFGRATGDDLLRLLSLRLGESIRAGDTIARVDGDRFVVLLAGMDDVVSVAAGGARILDAVSEPFALAGRRHRLEPSMGISSAPRNGTDAGALLQASQTALSVSQKGGRHSIEWFSSEMSAGLERNLRVEDELRLALERDELVLYFQPIVDAETNGIIAVEALVRWNHPVRGLVMPGDFISIAERAGLIAPLGDWVLGAACRQARKWHDEGFQLHVCVNVSSVQFRERNFVESVAAILAETAIPPRMLEIELTESVMVDGFTDVIETLTKLKLTGVRLAIDDFGTGYSSLSYLKYFPIDTLKIDRAFVADIAKDTFDRAIAKAVLTLANELDLDCVAEGVEDKAQVTLLRGLGCRRMQGYFYSRPLLPGALDGRLVPKKPAGV